MSNKFRKAMVLAISSIMILCVTACNSNNSHKKGTVHTSAGDVSIEGLMDIGNKEEKVIDKTKLTKENQELLNEICKPYEDGTAKESEIKDIEEQYGSVEEYRKYVEKEMKKQQIQNESYSGVEVTEEDREEFISKYSDTFKHNNAIMLVFDTEELCRTFYDTFSTESNDDIFNYINGLCNGQLKVWSDMNDYTSTTGIQLVHSGYSNKYFYTEDKGAVEELYNTLQLGQMSEPTPHGDKWMVIRKISENTIERDDSMIDLLMLEIKQKESYNAYIANSK